MSWASIAAKPKTVSPPTPSPTPPRSSLAADHVITEEQKFAECPVGNPNLQKRILVLDTGGLIKGSNLQNIADEFYTTTHILEEVKDEQTKHLLSTFPFEIKTLHPNQDAYIAVSAFARKTGDFASLSEADLSILSLSYMLEKEQKGTICHLRTTPPLPTQSKKGKKREKKQTEKVLADSEPFAATKMTTDKLENCALPREEEAISAKLSGISLGEQFYSKLFADFDSCSGFYDVKSGKTIDDFVQEQLESAQGIVANTGNESEDDGEGEWINEENIDEMLAKERANTHEALDAKPWVACVTTDYAMQNVLLQMGLNLSSVEGLRIKSMKQWALWCHSCDAITHNMNKLFCEKCGNSTLCKISVHVKADGTRIYNRRRKPINIRGTKYSIPSARESRHDQGLILREDDIDPRRQRAVEKARKKREEDGFFKEDAKRSLHEDSIVVGYGRRNPNQTRRNTGNKKKHRRPL
eukprot:GCRY01002951.1.p1 GENE.GCRY01002951.1~~GCRY01002951.1.p1  ORF type:complete len:469 (-),score=62.10 GCRY01002951.1:437-1843(-)